MSDRFVIKLCGVVTLLVLLTACGGQVAATPSPTDVVVPDDLGNGVIVFGDITDDPGEVIEGTQPLADYVAAQLEEFGIVEGQVRIASTADEMAQFLASGEVDIYFDSVYPATLISDATGATPFLRRWRFGVEDYFSVIFTSADSGITSLDQLGGHVIAFDNPYSTSGYLLPAVELLGRGYTLVANQSPADNEVGFIFSYDDANTLQWVLSGRADIGATDDYNFNVAFPEDVRERLVFLGKTDSVPRQVGVARPGMDPALLGAITQILISAHESEAGRAALEPFQTTRFDVFPEGIEAAQVKMRMLMELVQAIQLP